MTRYNRSEIMKAAWASYKNKEENWNPITRKPAYSFASFLRMAWANAKAEAAFNALSVEEKIEKLESRLFMLQMKDRFSRDDFNRETAIKNQLAELRMAS